MLHLGLLSTARINRLLVRAAGEVEDVSIVAVGSRDRRRADQHARELGVPRALSSYEEVLADPRIDAVYIALPNSQHVRWSIEALRAGKHVLCEKPLSRRPEDVEEAFDVADRTGLVLAEAFMWRHHPQTERLLAVMTEIGSLRALRAWFSFAVQSEDDPRLDGGLDGGALMDVGCYCVSAARLIAGEPLAAGAQQIVGGAGVDVRLTATMTFSNGLLAHFDCGLDMAPSHGLELIGAEGSIFVADPWHCREPGIEIRRAGVGVDVVQVEDADAYACELRDFAAAVAGRCAPRFGRSDALGQARTIAALYRSAATGRFLAP